MDLKQDRYNYLTMVTSIYSNITVQYDETGNRKDIKFIQQPIVAQN